MLAEDCVPPPLVGVPRDLYELLLQLLRRKRGPSCSNDPSRLVSQLDDLLEHFHELPVVASATEEGTDARAPEPTAPTPPPTPAPSHTSPPSWAWRVSATGFVSVVLLASGARWALTPAKGPPVELSVGTDHACVRYPSSEVECIGRPDVVATLPSTAELLAEGVGHQHVCVLDQEHHVVCSPQDRPGHEFSRDVPDRSMAWISAANDTTCGVDDAGRVHCWPVRERRAAPGGQCRALVALDAQPPISGPAKRVEVGWCLACAHLQTGAVECWTGDDPSSPISVFGGQIMATLEVGSDTACGTDAQGKTLCTDPRDGEVWSPKSVGSRTDGEFIVDVNLGDVHGCKRDRQGRVDCWQGDADGNGELDAGGGALEEWLAGRRFSMIRLGGLSTCGLLMGSQQLECFGPLQALLDRSASTGRRGR